MDEDLKKLLEENLRLTREVHEMTHKIKRYITFQKIMSLVYFLLIVVPIVLSLIYLPPLLSGVLEQYSELMGGMSGIKDANDAAQNLDIGELMKILNLK